VYLLVGGESDARCERIGQRLSELRLDWCSVADPLSGPLPHLDGVLTPWPRDGPQPGREQAAALLGWLWELDCRVVNRLPAHLWLRPRRSPLEWQPTLHEHGIAMVAGQITNDVLAARRFADRWAGHVTYRPIASPTRYRVTSDADFSELAKLVEYVPVCLLQPTRDGFFACAIGGDVLWSEPVCDESWRTRTTQALQTLAATLKLDVLELEFGRTDDAPVCVNVELFPDLEQYADQQQSVVDALIDVLASRL